MTIYICAGHWNDNKEKFTDMMVSDQEWNGKLDSEDQKIFFYTEGLPIFGDHGDFTITKAEIYE